MAAFPELDWSQLCRSRGVIATLDKMVRNKKVIGKRIKPQRQLLMLLLPAQVCRVRRVRRARVCVCA